MAILHLITKHSKQNRLIIVAPVQLNVLDLICSYVFNCFIIILIFIHYALLCCHTCSGGVSPKQPPEEIFFHVNS